MFKMVTIQELSPEIICHILKFCDFNTLCRLRATNKYLNDIVTNNRIFYEDALLTNQINKIFEHRWRTLYSPIDKLRISNNWKAGRYKRFEFCRQRVKYMPYIQIQGRYIWISWGCHVYCYERTEEGIHHRYCQKITATSEDITKFCVLKDTIAIASRGGSIQLNNGQILSEMCGADANCVDINNGNVIAGYSDGLVKVWDSDCLVKSSFVTIGDDAVLCCAWDFLGKNVAIGCAGRPSENYSPAPLSVWCLERNSDCPLWSCSERRSGAGVLSTLWLGPNVLLAAGYDCLARVWDARINGSSQAVATWVEPHGDTVYSLGWDGKHAVIGGAARHGRCTLWDLRRPRRYVQMYHAHKPNGRTRSSPVYSLALDAGELWVALDMCLAHLDFAAPKSDQPARNYDLPFLQFT